MEMLRKKRGQVVGKGGMEAAALDDVIQRLLDWGSSGGGGGGRRKLDLKESKFRQLCLQAKAALLSEPCLLDLRAPINICGDVRGQYDDLLRLFDIGGHPPRSTYLFLGNFLDGRTGNVQGGSQSLETATLLLAYKVKYPVKIYLLRGNWENTQDINLCNFSADFKKRFSNELWDVFCDVLNCLPVAAVINSSVFCVHSGLSPQLQSLNQIKGLGKPVDFLEIDHRSLLLNNLDPDNGRWTWSESAHGGIFKYGADVVVEFLERTHLDLICRGHDVVENGYQFFADRRLVTIFSAPSFSAGGNAGAMMSITSTDSNFMYSFQVFKPVRHNDMKNYDLTKKYINIHESNGQNMENPIVRSDHVMKVLEEKLCALETDNNVLRKERDEAIRVAKEFEGRHHDVSQQLQEANKNNLELGLKIIDSNYAAEMLEEEVRLLRSDCNKLQMQRDIAVQEAEELRHKIEQMGTSISAACGSEFSYEELQKATQNFSSSLRIGEGGFGIVYKGFLRNTQVAIKVLRPQSMQGRIEFHHEVAILSKVRHPNLVTLIGACPEVLALIYEFLPNGSLQDFLQHRDPSTPLTWKVRTRIMAEMCSALVFLHSIKPHPVVHGDLKPANILLDSNFNSRLSDFGISRFLTTNSETSAATPYLNTQPKGTLQYIDPEFLRTGELTTRSDVYSFGIIVLRLLTGRPALGVAKVVQEVLDKDCLHIVVDPSAGDWPLPQVKRLARLGLSCCQGNRQSRPDLAGDVWCTLESIVKDM